MLFRSGEAYQIVGNQIVFAEAPRPDSKVIYRNVDITVLPIKRLNLTQIGGIFPQIGDVITSKFGNVNSSAKVIDTSTNTVDIIQIIGTTFVNNARVDVSRTGFSAFIGSIDDVNQTTIFKFNETVTKVDLGGDTAIIEETNLDLDGNTDNSLVLSKTSGTAEFETGAYNILLNEIGRASCRERV